jgi:hypothetical protein
VKTTCVVLNSWQTVMGAAGNATHREPWNKGKIVGQKAPFKPNDIRALRVRLQMEVRVRELALFNLGIDSKLRGCDFVALGVREGCHGDQVAAQGHDPLLGATRGMKAGRAARPRSQSRPTQGPINVNRRLHLVCQRWLIRRNSGRPRQV